MKKVSFVFIWLVSSLFSSEIFDSLKSGYMIFREGNEPISEFVLSVDDGGYSHVGMLYKNNDKWQVIHATPSEKKDVDGGVVIDDFEFFIDKKRSNRFAIYEVEASSEEYEKAIKFMTEQIGNPFHYDESKGTYCTLVLYRAWQKAGVMIDASFRDVNLPLLRGRYLFPKEFRNSAVLNLVYKSQN